MRRDSPLVVVILLAVAATAAAWGLSRVLTPQVAPAAGQARIVSLSPAITDTLFAIGAGDQVVAVTDFDDYPDGVKGLPRAGTILTPNYEVIARARPSLVLGQTLQKGVDEKLGAIAPTRLLPWLTLDEITESIREIGRITGRNVEADRVARDLHDRIAVAAPANAPRVLALMPTDPGAPKDVFFIKQNSLHGTILNAAGVRNAIERDVPGAPTLSTEQILAADPDAILLLLPDPALDAAARQAYIDAWRGLGVLRAVKGGKIAVLAGPETYADGPRVLKFLDKLKLTLREMALVK